MKNVTIFDHPLIQHKTTIMRQKDTSNKEFRESVEEITMLMCYEALRDLPLTDIEIETPITKTTQKVVAGKPLAVVPILRAGLGMVNGLLALVPTAKVGHIGMYRDEETLMPHEYYCKLPPDIDKRLIVVVDPMLATGGSAIDAIAQIKSYGGQHIKFLCLIAAPEGIKALTEAHP
ncbi:MAG: uracil phosphoribosyltransferase, partial [Oscillospiraceae bacterium]|nr:uracil phosphoribosyltransferase [Oscillospiraceae bacterium]